MTNINCSANCIYQKEGKCSYDDIFVKTLTTIGSDCAYFSPKEKK